MRNYRMSLLVMVLFGLSLASEPSTSSMVGQVTDAEGAAIRNARVLIHWDPAGSAVGLTDNIGLKNDAVVTTDAAGMYSTNLPPGFYDVFISAMAFTPTATKVRTKRGQRTTFNAKLQADPLVSKELAH